MSEARVKAEAFADGIAKPIKNAPAIAQAHKVVEIAAAKAGEATRKFGAGSIEAASANLALDKANGRLEKAMQGSTRELTEQQKIQARIALIMKDSARQAHNFAETSDEAANAQRRLAARTEDLETALGQKLLPLKKDVLAFLNGMLDKFNALDAPKTSRSASRASGPSPFRLLPVSAISFCSCFASRARMRKSKPPKSPPTSRGAEPEPGPLRAQPEKGCLPGARWP